jgi:hypothetical protein
MRISSVGKEYTTNVCVLEIVPDLNPKKSKADIPNLPEIEKGFLRSPG